MSRRTATLSLLLGITASVALALPSLAKEGAEAKLDTAIHRDAAPGSTIAVAWSLFQVVDDKESPFSSSGVYMRLKGVDGKSSTEVVGTESPIGSGHYKAIIQVPESGIGEVEVGLRGEMCTAADNCSRSDIIFPLTDDSMVTGHGARGEGGGAHRVDAARGLHAGRGSAGLDDADHLRELATRSACGHRRRHGDRRPEPLL